MSLKNKKKIRIIIGSLNTGGTEKQLLKIINNLVKKNWKIELITLKELGILGKPSSFEHSIPKLELDKILSGLNV